MAAYKTKGKTWLAVALQQQLQYPDPFAKYYLIWRQNSLDTIKWLAGLEVDPNIPCTYGWEEIEWLVDYYEQRALLWWCKAREAGMC